MPRCPRAHSASAAPAPPATNAPATAKQPAGKSSKANSLFAWCEEQLCGVSNLDGMCAGERSGVAGEREQLADSTLIARLCKSRFLCVHPQWRRLLLCCSRSRAPRMLWRSSTSTWAARPTLTPAGLPRSSSRAARRRASRRRAPTTSALSRSAQRAPPARPPSLLPNPYGGHKSRGGPCARC